MAIKAYEIPHFTMTGVNGVDFKDKRYSPVTIDASGKLQPVAAKAAAIGFIQHDYAAGEVSRVVVEGITFAKANAAIAEGAQVEAVAGGYVQTLTDGKPLGVCVAAASAKEAICSILIGK